MDRNYTISNFQHCGDNPKSFFDKSTGLNKKILIINEIKIVMILMLYIRCKLYMLCFKYY